MVKWTLLALAWWMLAMVLLAAVGYAAGRYLWPL